MFEFVRTHNRIFQFLLLLLILPSFVFFGVQSYSSFMNGSNASVADVDGRKITRAELDNAVRDQIERMRRQNPTIDAKVFDTPATRQGVLDELVRERLMSAAAAKEHLTASDVRVKQLFESDPQLAFLRNPDGSVNQGVLAMQGMTPQMFLERLRQDVSERQVLAGVGATGLATSGPAALAFDALLQQREVQIQRFDPKDFVAQVKPTDAEVEAFYKSPANAARFQLPESAKVEYLVLDADALMKTVSVSEEDERKYYADNQAKYAVPEERRASHILIKVDKSAPAAERAKAKARAEELLAEARKNPAGFADLARKNSQDEGSAPNGGDLDYFGHGAMVKPFEDAAFALKQGEISNVVESDFGYHIIELTGVRGGDKKTFDQVRGDIETQLKKEAAGKRYTELAEQFSNLVYEQSDSLKPAADKLGLTVQTATVLRKPTADTTGLLASGKLLDAMFSNDSLHNKRNTEAVETAPNQLVSAHVLAYFPLRLQPFADVSAPARELLISQRATSLAQQAGQARKMALQKGGATADLSGLGEAQVVSRAKPGQPPLPRPVLIETLKADVSKLPAAVGVDGGDGAYYVVRIDKLLPRDPTIISAKRAADQYAQTWAAAEAAAYYETLKSQLKVNIKSDALKVDAAAGDTGP